MITRRNLAAFALAPLSSGRGKRMPFGKAVGEGFVNPPRPTPWTPIPLAVGWSSVAGFTAQYRRNAGNLELAGQITATITTTANTFNPFSTALPGGFFNPTVNKFGLAILLGINGGPQTEACIIAMLVGGGNNGILQFSSNVSNTSPNPITVVLDGCIIPINSM